MGNILDCYKALSKDELQKNRNSQNDVKQRDTRNLYLVKEGGELNTKLWHSLVGVKINFKYFIFSVILAGTKAAEGVSAADMAKRLQVEQYKTQMLRNLNMFVSKTRLIVHNLPASWDDTKLRNLFKRYAGIGAVIKEARIMRNLKILDSKGIGKSKEYGFVEFTQHEHALRALRAINNNPDIFTPNRRPIVAFSIENKSKIKAKEKRLLNSKLKNPISKSFNPNSVNPQNDKIKEDIEVEPKQFSGTTAKPGVIKMRNRYTLKTQAKLHHEHMKKQKKKQKFEKKRTLEQKKQDFIRQPRQKINKKPKNKTDDNFSTLVDNYKRRLKSAEISKKSKWYEA